MRRIRSVSGVSGAALLAAVLVAPPAVAQRHTESDPAGDMTVSIATAPAPAHRRLDIRRVFVRHTAHFVIIRTVTRALTRPRGDESFSLSGYIKVNREAQPSESVAWAWTVSFDEHHRRLGSHMWGLDAEHQQQYGCDGRDEGLNATAHYNGNWVTVTIPRRCLAYDPSFETYSVPRWVRVSVRTSHGLGSDRYYLDDLGPHDQDAVYGAHLTPRLYPG